MSLTISIHSFSYLKKGIPSDSTGNGGGFVFDCRFIENPGRQPEFKTQTGKDRDVIIFLDNNEPMQEFLTEVSSIVSKAIDNYLERKFSHLMISFGCTGGQHRSVYSAEKLNVFIQSKFPQVKVNLHHNEFPELNGG